MAENIGRVISVSGPAIDVQFEEKTMPPIYQALRVVSEGFVVPQPLDVVVEVQQHLGEGRVRCVAMSSTDGMVRGMKAIDTGAGITIPVGRGTLGRVMNVLGQPVDELGPITSEFHMPIHRPAPAFDEQSTNEEMFETASRSLTSSSHSLRRKDWPLRRRGRGQNGRHPGTDQQRRDQPRRLLGIRRSG